MDSDSDGGARASHVPVSSGGPEPATAPARLGTVEVLVRLTAVEILLVLAGLTVLTWSSIPPGSLDRDWTMWYRAGDLLWQGRLDEVYSGSFTSHYPFPYPPFTIYLFALFALVPIRWAHAVAALASCVALLAALRLLRQTLPGRSGAHLTVLLATAASAPFLSTLVVGQLSALYLLCVVASLAAWRADRPFLAGAALGFLLVKPNIGLPLILCCAAAREWRVLWGVSACGAVLVLSTLPMGPGVWRDEYTATLAVAELAWHDPTVLWKHQTLYAFLSSLLASSIGVQGVNAVWKVAVAALGVLVLALWAWAFRPSKLPRFLGMAVLFVVAGNSYLWFYDGLLLVVPGSVWFLRADTYASPRVWKASGLLLGATFVWQHASLFVLKGGPALSGCFLTIWLLLECWDLAISRRTGFEPPDEPLGSRSEPLRGTLVPPTGAAASG